MIFLNNKIILSNDELPRLATWEKIYIKGYSNKLNFVLTCRNIKDGLPVKLIDNYIFLSKSVRQELNKAISGDYELKQGDSPELFNCIKSSTKIYDIDEDDSGRDWVLKFLKKNIKNGKITASQVSGCRLYMDLMNEDKKIENNVIDFEKFDKIELLKSVLKSGENVNSAKLELIEKIDKNISAKEPLKRERVKVVIK